VFASLGPQPQQYNAYARADGPGAPPPPPPGTTGEPATVVDFYNDTRRKYFRATYTLMSGLGPLAIFAGTIALVAWLLADRQPPPALGLMDIGETDRLPVGDYCGSSIGRGPLLDAVLAGTLHFSATHVALIVICVLAFVASAACTLNVLQTHNVPRHRPRLPMLQWFIATIIPIMGGVLVYVTADIFVGRQIAQLFGRLFPIPSSPSGCGALVDAIKLRETLDLQMQIGAGLVSLAVFSLVIAAATLAHRYERSNINGAWSDSYVLRHKLNSLLTLFFTASILLVLINVALSSAMDWSSGILDAVSAATADQSSDSGGPGGAKAGSGSDSNAGSAAAASDSAGAGATKPASSASAAKSGAAAAFAAIKSLKTAVVNFAGILGSLLLIAIFAPALYFMTSEIELAGKCHAYYDTYSPGPSGPLRQPEPMVVAGWKAVQDWKESHGLSLSYTSLTSSFIAVLAPLLSSSLIDLTKVATSAG
jgi:hypothetical protein